MSAAEELGKNLRILSDKIDAHTEARKFSEIWDWQSPSLDKTDLAYMAKVIADKVESLDWSKSSSDTEVFIDNLSQKVQIATQRNVPNLFAGPQGADALIAFLYGIELQLGSQVVVDQMKGALALPVSLHKRVTLAEQKLDSATKSLDGIAHKISDINNAYEAAEQLPVTLQGLEQVLRDIEISKTAASRFELAAKKSSEDSEASKQALCNAEITANETLGKVKDAYRAATSQGLAQAFAEKSKQLNESMLLWLLALIAALSIAGMLAAERFPAILSATTGTPDWGVVLVNITLAALSLTPPAWLAWVSTKQLGQRFRLAEDYGYKAALSAAYEGYRTEAAKLDPLFEAQLFATAIGRLDELPLRLIDKEVPGSPLHEFLKSNELRDASATFPELKEKLISILRLKSDVATPKVPAE